MLHAPPFESRKTLRDPFKDTPRPDGWRPRIRRVLLDLDARIDFGVYQFKRWGRELYERFTVFMDRFHVSGWRRWYLIEPVSEGLSLGAIALVGALALAIPAFRETTRGRLAEGQPARGHLPRPLRQRGRRPRHPPQRFHPAGGFPRPPDQGRARHRGPPLLRAFRHRRAGHDARADGQYARRRRGAGRLLDHPAARQEPVSVERAHHRAQGEGGVPGGVARGAAVEERDPEALSRPRLSRRRHLRGRRRRAVLFQQVGARGEPVGGGDARRPVQGAVEVRARTSTCRRRARAPTWCSTIWSRPDS